MRLSTFVLMKTVYEPATRLESDTNTFDGELSAALTVTESAILAYFVESPWLTMLNS